MARRKSSGDREAAACEVIRYGIRKAQENGVSHLDVIGADRWMSANCDFSDSFAGPRRRKARRHKRNR